MLMSCLALAIVAIQSDPMSGHDGLEVQAQDSGIGNRLIDLMVDELLANYPGTERIDSGKLYWTNRIFEFIG